MTRFFTAVIGAVLALFFYRPTYAADLATCGVSEGYAYYPKIGMAASDPAAGRWSEDRISDGRFTLTLAGDDTLDLLVLDALGGIFSARAAGGLVRLAGKTDETLTVVVLYPERSIETYTFVRDKEGKAEAIWTVNRFGSAVPKAAAFRASCSFLSF